MEFSEIIRNIPSENSTKEKAMQTFIDMLFLN